MPDQKYQTNGKLYSPFVVCRYRPHPLDYMIKRDARPATGHINGMRWIESVSINSMIQPSLMDSANAIAKLKLPVQIE